MNVRDKKRWPAPCPPLCLYHYMALLQSLLLRRKAECLRAQGKVFAGVGQSLSFFKNQEVCGSFWRLVLGKSKLMAVCGTI